MAEDLTSLNWNNMERVNQYLKQSSQTSLIPPTSPTLAERGGAYLLLRYAYEQSTDKEAFLNRLLKNKKTGVDNFEEILKDLTPFQSLPEIIQSLGVTLALESAGVSNSKYQFQDVTPNSDTGSFSGVCFNCSAQGVAGGTTLSDPVITNLTSFGVSTTVKPTTIQIYHVKNSNDSLTINSANHSGMMATLIPLSSN